MDQNWDEKSRFSNASNSEGLKYVVIQVTLKEKFVGTGSKNLIDLENTINNQASKGYRLHSFSTSISHSAGLMGGDRIQATLIFEKLS